MTDLRFLFAMLLAVASALALIAFLPILGFVRAGAEATWVASLYHEKTKIAHDIVEPKVLVVSGSNALFDIDTEYLTRIIGRPAVNFGTHAGLGLTYILERAGREIRQGDIVLLTPEYELMLQNAAPNILTSNFVAFFDRGFIAERPFLEQLRYIFGYGILPSITETVRVMIRGRPATGRDDVRLDDLGNARGNTVAASDPDKRVFDPPSAAMAPVSPDAVVALRRFAAIAAKRKATVLVAPPGLLHLAVFDSAEFAQFHAEVRSTVIGLGMVYLGDLDTGWLGRTDIYDTIYHANDRGRGIYTERIAKIVCGAIQCAKVAAARLNQ